MKERKTNKQPHKQTRNIVNPFLDDKCRQRLSKAVSKAEKLIKPMSKESNQRDKDELSDKLRKQIKDIRSFAKEIASRREDAEAIRDAIEDTFDEDFIIRMCGVDVCDDDSDNEDDESCFCEAEYIMVKPKDLRNLLKYAGDRAMFLFMVRHMSYLDAITHSLLDSFKDFEKTRFYKRNEGVINMFFNESFTEEDG